MGEHMAVMLTSVMTLPAFFLAFNGLAFPPCTHAQGHGQQRGQRRSR